MLKVHLSEAWHLSQSEAARPPQPGPILQMPRGLPSKHVLPGVPERVRLHPSLCPVIQRQGQAVDPREMLDELKMPMTNTFLALVPNDTSPGCHPHPFRAGPLSSREWRWQAMIARDIAGKKGCLLMS